MTRTCSPVLFALWIVSAGAVAAETAKVDRSLNAEQVVERYVAARGGAEAWHKVMVLGWTGHVDSGGSAAAPVPFLMFFRRPNASRFEIITQSQRSVRIFDGSNGWRMRPAANGLPEVKEYNDEERNFALDAGGLDGPLLDHQHKGVTVALTGIEAIEGHDCYRIKISLPTGHTQTAWIDTKSFLELRYDRPTRGQSGQPGTVSVYLRNYQTIQGLVMPMTIETRGAAGQPGDTMTIEKVAINPVLPSDAFSKPQSVRPRHNGVLINTAEPPPSAGPSGRH